MTVFGFGEKGIALFTPELIGIIDKSHVTGHGVFSGTLIK